MSAKSEMLEQLDILRDLAEANICRLGDIPMRGIALGIKAIMSREFMRGASREDVARYMGISTRTLERWAGRFDDFPVARHWGTKEISYDEREVIAWWKKHKEEVEFMK